MTRELPWDEAGVTWDRLVELGTRMRETGEEDISLREALDRVQWRPSSAPQHFVEWFNFSKSAGQRVEDQCSGAEVAHQDHTEGSCSCGHIHMHTCTHGTVYTLHTYMHTHPHYRHIHNIRMHTLHIVQCSTV